MSREGLEFVKSIDGRLDINNLKNRTFACLESATAQNYIVYPSTGVLGNVSQINFNCPVTDLNTYIDRVPLINIRGTITVTGVSAGAGIPLLQMPGVNTGGSGADPGNIALDGLRCSPLSQLFTTFGVTLNGSQNSTNLGLYSRVIQRFERNDWDIQSLSMSPTMPDYSLEYQDLVGTSLNPLAPYGTNTSVDPRGAFSGLTLLTNTSTGVADSATLEFDLTEPFWISPFSEIRGKGEPVCLKGITNFLVSLTTGGRGNSPIAGAFGSMFSHNNDNPNSGTLTSGTVSFSAANILMHFMEAPLGQQLPDLVNYSWVRPSLYQQSCPGVLNGGVMSQNSQTLQLDTIPQKILFWVDEADYLFDCTRTDTTPFRIDNISVRWDTSSNMLADCQPQDIWQLARASGFNGSWNQWNGCISQVTGRRTGTGSWGCIRPGIDFPLMKGQCPGQNGKHTFQIRINATNISSRNLAAVNVNVLVIEEGVMTINGTQVSYSSAIVEASDVKSVEDMVPVTHVPSKSILGGSFWSDVKNFLGSVARPLHNVAKKFLPGAVTDIADIALTAAGKGMGPGRYRGGAMLTGPQLLQLR